MVPTEQQIDGHMYVWVMKQEKRREFQRMIFSNTILNKINITSAILF